MSSLLAGPLQNSFLEGGCIGLNGLHLVMLFGEVGGGGCSPAGGVNIGAGFGIRSPCPT